MKYLSNPKSIAKALVPLVVAGVVVALEAIGVDLPTEQDEAIASGLILAVLTFLVPNGE